MNNRIKKFCAYLVLGLMFSSNCICAQCSSNKDSVTITVETESHAFGIYWQLVPDTNACGVNQLFVGGNITEMDCNSAGTGIASGGNGYSNYSTIVEGPWCLNRDSVYSIRYIEDHGGYYNRFTVNINGCPRYTFTTDGDGAQFTFTIIPPYAYDVGMKKINFTNYLTPGSKSVSGTFYNYSFNTITNIELCYNIDNGPPVTHLINGINIAPFTSYDFIHPDAWIPSGNGSYEIKVWCQMLNGNPDMDHSNDTIEKTVVVGNAIPNIIDWYLTNIPIYRVIADSSEQIYFPSDLDFQTILSKNELWVINMGDTVSNGSTVTFYNAGDTNQVSLWRQDPHSDHFMFLPAALTFADNTNFASADAVLDAHHNMGHFAGPTLWSSDSLIYALPIGLLGSHIDMLHQSPFAMGIADDHENVYWVYDGYNQRITRYDFAQPHASGADNHNDGIVRRYDDIILNRINDTIPNHMVLDKSTGWLYVVDNGNQRVVRMDINTGSITGTFPAYQEPLAEHSLVTGVTWNNFITTGLVQPAGIDLINNRLIVSDYNNGDIVIYDKSGNTGIELGRIHTGAAGVAGIKIGPDGRIWYVNQLRNTVVRIDTVLSVGLNTFTLQNDFSIYPNPADDQFTVFNLQLLAKPNHVIKVFDTMGKVVYSTTISTANCRMRSADWRNGVYFIQFKNDQGTINKKLVVKH